MADLIRRLHIYGGLAILLALLVFSAAGLAVSFRGDPREHVSPPKERVPFAFPPGATKQQIVDLAREKLAFPHSKPMKDWMVAEDDAGNLEAWMYSPNGLAKMRLLKSEGVAELILEPNDLGEYMNQMHGALPLSKPDPLVLVWSLYIELAIFGLLFLSISGVYLWLTSRPRLWWARASFAGGILGVVALMVLGS